MTSFDWLIIELNTEFDCKAVVSVEESGNPVLANLWRVCSVIDQYHKGRSKEVIFT